MSIENKIREAMKRFHRGLIVVGMEPAAPAQPTCAESRSDQKSAHGNAPPPAFSPDEVRFLVLHSGWLSLPVTKSFAMLGFTPNKGTQIDRGLTNRGIIKGHYFSSGKRGGDTKLIEIIKFQGLEIYGIRPHDPLTKGNWEHNLGSALVVRLMRRKGDKIQFEAPVGDGETRVDVLIRSKTGEMHFWQIGISSPEREVKALVNLQKHAAPGGGRIHVVCRDTDFAREFRRIQKKEHGKQSESPEILLISDLLSAYWCNGRGAFNVVDTNPD